MLRLYLCNGGPVLDNNNAEESSDEEEAPVPPPDPMPSTSRGNQRSPVRAQRWTYLVRQRQQRPYFHNSNYSPLPTIPTPDFEVANYLMNEPRPYRPIMGLSSNPVPQRPSHNEDFGRDGNRIQFSASLSFPSNNSSGNGNIPREYSIRFDAQPPNDHIRGIPETYPTWRNYQPPPRPTRLMMNDWDANGPSFPQANSFSGGMQDPQNLHLGPPIIHPNAQNIQQRGAHGQYQGGHNQNMHQGGNMHHQNSPNLNQPGPSSQLHNNSNQPNHYQGGQFDNHGQMQNPHQRR